MSKYIGWCPEHGPLKHGEMLGDDVGGMCIMTVEGEDGVERPCHRECCGEAAYEAIAHLDLARELDANAERRHREQMAWFQSREYWVREWAGRVLGAIAPYPQGFSDPLNTAANMAADLADRMGIK